MSGEEIMVRELTDSEVDAVSGGLLNFFTTQINSNYNKQSNTSFFSDTHIQKNENWTVQVNV